jgi:LmbE family N-acetylglucosaminyl deacetylase
MTVFKTGRPISRLGTVLVLVIMAGGTLLTIELRRRHELYWYDVSQSYEVSFTGRVASVPVEISPDGFVLPETTASWDTALLRLHVSSTWAGRWSEPSVAIGTGREVDRQFFERGAEGARYLVLTPEVARPGASVRLHGNHLRWPVQRSELLLFENPAPAAGRVLVLAPHPDDAEIAAFGLYSSHDSFVVTITAGNYVDGRYAHLVSEERQEDTLKAHVRTWDSLVVPSWGGVPPDRTANLGYLGTSLDRLYAERHEARADDRPSDPRFGRYRRGAIATLLEGRKAAPTWASLVEDLATLVRTVRPSIVVAPHPILDGGVDHALTTTALLEALERPAGEDVTLLLYTNHHPLSEYFPFGPADSTVTLPPWFDATVSFGGIYSHRLDGNRQLDKLFALDAMHDLRDAPRRLLGTPEHRFVLRVARSLADLIRDPVADHSYYRRAVRPNELFFVYGPGDRAALAIRERRDTRTGSPSGPAETRRASTLRTVPR